MIPKRTHDVLGFWCEDYGDYGEEDLDYCIRVEYYGLFNIYMEHEDAGIHLPSGKAAKIGYFLTARDGAEEHLYAEYRDWKDACRRKVVRSGKVATNRSRYKSDRNSLYHRSFFVEEWLKLNDNSKATGI